jgi:uncharacterized protein (TIGR00296 family)
LTLTLEQGARLVSIARKTVDNLVLKGTLASNDVLLVPPEKEDEFLRARRGAVATLSKLSGGLRGCIGVPFPVRPLWEAVVESAVGAASRDPRFPKVVAGELDGLLVEVSALSHPELIRSKPLDLPQHVRVGTDGLIVSHPGTSVLLLPQVATEMKVGPQEFLSLACQKAGLSSDSWLTGNVEVQRFQAEIFAEDSPRGHLRQSPLREP